MPSWPFVSSLAVLLIAAGGWLYPLVTFGTAGLSLSGPHDEAVGFRYFYTLRRLYGDHEQPWVPHGQVEGLVHTGLQLLLTAAGYSPMELHPRIDIWTYAAPAVPLVLATLALVWAVQPIRPFLGRVLVALVMIAVTYETAIYVEYHLTTPEYHPWVHLYAALALGWLLRLAEQVPTTVVRPAVLLGLYAAACLGTKPSYLPFPLTIGLVLLFHQTKVWRAAGLVIGSALVAVATLLALTWAFYLGDTQMVLYHFQMLPPYVGGELAGTPVGAWVWEFVGKVPRGWPGSLADPRLWLIPLPFVLAVSLWVQIRWQIVLALLVSASLYLYAADRRPSYATFVETLDFLVVAGTLWIWGVLVPWVRAWLNDRVGPSRMHQRARFAAGQLVLALAVLYAASWVNTGLFRFDAKVRPLFEVATAGERRLAAFLAERRGRTLFAFADYPHRPISIDAAIHRGGIPLGTSWEWTSPLLRNMFPDRMYLLGDTGKTAVPRPNLGRYRHIVYTYQPAAEREVTAVALLRQRLNVRFDDYDCPFEHRFWDTTQPTSNLTDVIIVRACRRLDR